MSSKLQTKLDAARDEWAGEQLTEHLSAHDQRRRESALIQTGAFHAANKIASAVQSELIRAMKQFQTEHGYLALGFANMVEYLKSDLSPLTKSQYYEYKTLLEREGDELFSLYSEIGLSARTRKQLGAGQVEIDGNTLIVKTDDDEVVIDATDTHRLVEIISSLADANTLKATKLAGQAETIAGHDEEKAELRDEIERVRASKAAEIGEDDHALAIVTLGLSFRQLIEAVEEMSQIEREQFAPLDFERIAGWMTDLSITFGRGPEWSRHISTDVRSPIETGSDDDLIARALDGDIVDMNDAELVSHL